MVRAGLNLTRTTAAVRLEVGVWAPKHSKVLASRPSLSPQGATLPGQHVVGMEGESCVHGVRVGGGRGGRRTHPAVSSPKMMHMRRATLAGGPTTGTSCRSPWLWDGPGGPRWRSPLARAPRCEPGTRAVLWPLLVDSSMPGGWPPTRRRARKRQGNRYGKKYGSHQAMPDDGGSSRH